MPKYTTLIGIGLRIKQTLADYVPNFWKPIVRISSGLTPNDNRKHWINGIPQRTKMTLSESYVIAAQTPRFNYDLGCTSIFGPAEKSHASEGLILKLSRTACLPFELSRTRKGGPKGSFSEDGPERPHQEKERL